MPFEFDLLSRQTVSLNERLLWLWLLPLILELRDIIELAYKVSVGVCLQDATILRVQTHVFEIQDLLLCRQGLLHQRVVAHLSLLRSYFI